jgi:hypothetical protein
MQIVVGMRCAARTVLALFALNCLNCGAIAEPDAEVKWLMGKPWTLMDGGINELSERLNRYLVSDIPLPLHAGQAMRDVYKSGGIIGPNEASLPRGYSKLNAPLSRHLKSKTTPISSGSIRLVGNSSRKSGLCDMGRVDQVTRSLTIHRPLIGELSPYPEAPKAKSAPPT